MPALNILSRIQEYDLHFTPTEKVIAHFFLENKQAGNFTAKEMSRKLHVSEAALSRFAQKMGYHGYREFLYLYLAEFEKSTPPEESHAKEQASPVKFTKTALPPSDEVFSVYGNILSQTAASVDPKQLKQIGNLLCKAGQVFVYGLGSSGLAAMEFELRMLKLGIDIKAITDYHQMVLNETRLKKSSLVIGITLSAQTTEIRDALLFAASKEAKTLCITAGHEKDWFAQIDEVLSVSTIKGLEYGNMVSPMLPLLLNLDLIYAFCLSAKKKRDGAEKTEEEHVLWERLKHYHGK